MRLKVRFNFIHEDYQESDLPFEQCDEERGSRRKIARVMVKLCLLGSSFAEENL